MDEDLINPNNPDEPYNNLDKPYNNKNLMGEEQLMALQERAFLELEIALSSCETQEQLIEIMSEWQDKYNILDIDDFFGENYELLIKIRNLINDVAQKLTKQNEELNKFLNEHLQRRTFMRLYSICLDAKNYKDFDTAKDKLKDWLKDHPKDSWSQFNDFYKNYFEKVANEDYLKLTTGVLEQEKAFGEIKEIVEYSMSNSDFIFLKENVDLWNSNFPNRDFLSAEQNSKIDELISTAYEKLTPPNIDKENLGGLTNVSSFILYQSLITTMSSSSNKEIALFNWFSNHLPEVANLNSNDNNKFKDAIMKKFKINNIPDYTELTEQKIQTTCDFKNIKNMGINFIVYKLDSRKWEGKDVNLFSAIYKQADLITITKKKELVEAKKEPKERVKKIITPKLEEKPKALVKNKQETEKPKILAKIKGKTEMPTKPNERKPKETTEIKVKPKKTPKTEQKLKETTKITQGTKKTVKVKTKKGTDNTTESQKETKILAKTNKPAENIINLGKGGIVIPLDGNNQNNSKNKERNKQKKPTEENQSTKKLAVKETAKKPEEEYNKKLKTQNGNVVATLKIEKGNNTAIVAKTTERKKGELNKSYVIKSLPKKIKDSYSITRAITSQKTLYKLPKNHERIRNNNQEEEGF